MIENGSIITSRTVDDIDWNKLADIFHEVGWGTRNVSDVETAFSKCPYVTVISQNNNIIAAGRAISDGLYYAMLCDIVVRTEYQKQGYGTLIVDDLLQQVSHLSWVTLTATPGRTAFYKRFGFSLQRTAMAKLRISDNVAEQYVFSNEV